MQIRFKSNLNIILSCCLIFSIALLGSACDKANDKAKSAKPKTPKAHLVEVSQAEWKDISISRTLPGTLQARREVRLINQAEGLLKALPVYPGDKVKPGEQLAQLDDTLIKAELAKAQASLKQARVDLRRLEDLAERKLTSESEIAQAQTLTDIAHAEQELKQTQFSHTKILAPFSGTISERHAEPGDVMPLHTHVLSLIDTSSLKAEIHLSELLLPLVQQQSQVDIMIDALGKQQFSGKIKRIYPAIDKTSRRGTVEIILSPTPNGALPGQLCRVTIHTRKQQRLMVPQTAVRHDKQGSYVFSVIDNKAQRIDVRTGIQQDEEIEILQGLENQQTIISQGFFGLKNKMPVNVITNNIDAKPAENKNES